MLVLKPLLSGMTCLKRCIESAALFEQSARSGSPAASPGVSWPVYILMTCRLVLIRLLVMRADKQSNTLLVFFKRVEQGF